MHSVDTAPPGRDLGTPRGPAPSFSASREAASEITVPVGVSYDEAIVAVQKQLVGRALRQAGGVVRRAAQLLQMDSSRLAKLRRRLGLAGPPADDTTG